MDRSIFKIKNFRGVFMKDELPLRPKRNECGILNLENSDEDGSHWVAYFKRGMDKYYFDSYGDAKPPKELINYLGSDNLYYNKDAIQFYDDPPICGHLCLLVLQTLCNGNKYTDRMLKDCRNYFFTYNKDGK